MRISDWSSDVCSSDLSFVNGYCVDSVHPGTGIGFKRGFLNGSLAGTHDDEIVVQVFLFLQLQDVNERFYLVILLDLNQFLNGASLGRPAAFRNLIPLPQVATTLSVKTEYRTSVEK